MQNNEIKRDWYLFDAKDQVLGRLASEIANHLRGKLKADFAPNQDHGDFVVVINADKFILTGKKEETKRYYHHTGYLGNLKTETVTDLKKKNTGEVLVKAITGMLPKNRLQNGFLKRLKVYTDDVHPHLNAKFVNIK